MKLKTLAVFILLTAANASADIEVYFTGRLMGHARYPERQTDANECRAENGSKFADSFARQMRETSFDSSSSLLVGLGDNFGPEYGARYIQIGKNDLPKELIVWAEPAEGQPKQWLDITNTIAPSPTHRTALERYGREVEAKGAGTIPFDNAACFFVRQNYKALVPGKHDFVLGPERLRQISAWLGKEKVAMLGANILVQTKLVDALPELPERLRNLQMSGTNLPPETRYTLVSKAETKITLPKVVFPWMVKFTLEAKSVSGVRICDAADKDGDRLTNCEALKFEPGTTGKQAIFLNDAIAQATGRQKAICAEEGSPKGTSWYCKPFSVARPFLHRGAWEDENGRHTPFVVHQNVAIFGVVNASMGRLVGQANLTYRNLDPRYRTTVEFTDEEQALRQALEACAEDTECRKTDKRVLLAQMPEERAGALARKFSKDYPFHVVLAESNVRGATPAQTISRAKEDWNERPVVFSPGPVYDPDDPEHLHVRIHKMELVEMPNLIDRRHEVFKNDDVPYPPPAAAAEAGRARRIAMTAEQRFGGGETRKKVKQWIEDRAKKAYRDVDMGNGKSMGSNAILASMRYVVKADVALTQGRDIFRAENVLDVDATARDFREIVDRILWKGDLLLKVPVKGSVLVSVMERSAELSTEDGELANFRTEQSRSLLTLGIMQDPDTKKWYVNGAELVPDKLYGVAMPDFMVLGETDFPQLKNPDGSGPYRLEEVKQIRILGASICAVVTEGTEDQTFCGPSVVDAADYLDVAGLLPPGRTTRPSLGRTTYASLIQSLNRQDPFKDLREKNTIEMRVQSEPVYSVALEKLEGAYNLYMNNQPDQQTLESRFAGITSPQAAVAGGSSGVTANMRLRGKIARASGDLYLLGEEYYNREKLRGSDNAYVPNIKQNLMGFEAGWNPRFLNRTVQTPEFLGLLSFRYEQQVEKPLLKLKIGGVDVRQEMQRTPSFLGKAGFRWQGRNSWLEAGLYAGRRFELVSAYGVARASYLAPLARNLSASELYNDPAGRAAGAFICSVKEAGPGFVPLSDCIANGLANSAFRDTSGKVLPGAFRVDTVSRPRVGNFLQFKFQWPIPGIRQAAYVMENRGEFNYGWNNDLQVDTKYFDTWSHSLKIDIWKNLSVVPKLEYLYFRNKVNRTSITGLTSTIGLQYRFEWRRTLPLGPVLKYPYPPSDK